MQYKENLHNTGTGGQCVELNKGKIVRDSFLLSSEESGLLEMMSNFQESKPMGV
ncbi:unnamed protein product [Choristocarpus tenellus]